MPALWLMANVGRGGIIHEVSRAIEVYARRPEVLSCSGPGGLFRKRVAEMLPTDEVLRPRDLDVDPLAFAQSLSGVGVIIAVGREDQRRIGEILVEHGIEV